MKKLCAPQPGTVPDHTGLRPSVAACLALVSLAGALDLACTLYARRAGWLEEMNPVAKYMLDSCGGGGLAIFKAAITAAACLALRAAALDGRRPAAVLAGAAAALAVCAAVAVQWVRCFAELR